MEAREANVKEMEAKLNDLSKKIAAIEAEVRKRHDDAEARLMRLTELRAKHKTAHEQMEAIRKATREELDYLRSGWEEVVNDIQDALAQMARKY